MTALWLLAAFVVMCMAAVNSGFEVGVYSLSRIRLRYRLTIGDPRASALDSLLLEPEQLISGILVAQNLAVYFVTAVVASVLAGAGVRGAQGWSTLTLAVVFFIFVEAVPKNVFRRAADLLVYPLARPYRVVLAMLKPAVVALRLVTHFVRRVSPGADNGFDPLFTRERLAFYMREGHSEGVLSTYQVELTHNILRGENVTVSRAMVAIENVVAVPADVSWEDFARISGENGFSRYPVYRGEKENITHLLNIFDCHLVEMEKPPLEGLMRPLVYFAPEVDVMEALRVLREARQPMGIVTENSRALGIVTTKDCVEEIVGELYEW